MLTSLIANIDAKRGFSSPEVCEDGERIGFDVQDEQKNTATLAGIGTPTNYAVGRYHVDVVSLERFIDPLFKHAAEQLLFIDEIGQMQLYSERVKGLVKDYIEASNDFVGTISRVYGHPFIQRLREDSDILLCTVTHENRESLQAALSEALSHRAMFNNLPKAMQRTALDLARSYLANDQYISLKKLFKNAIPYVCGRRISKQAGGFAVQGNTHNHQVRIVGANLVCDCDFFNGRGQFADNGGECSHIQSAKLFSS